MNRIVFILGVWLFPAACTALGAAGVFLLRRQARPATRRILCGMAAGIMLAASVWSLLLPAIARSQGRAAWVPPALGLILGAVGLLRLEDAAGQLLAGGPGHCGRMVLAVTLHNLPEGMVVGLAAALALHGDADAVSGAGSAYSNLSADGNEYEMGPGTVTHLAPGEKVQFGNPNIPTAGFETFVKTLCRLIGSALELPYDVLIKEFNSSYSASRGALLEAWEAFKMRRSWFVADFCQPIYEIFLAEAVALGRINAPGFFTDPLVREAWCGARWIGPVQGQLDPKKEAEAALLLTGCGIKTHEQITRELGGGDWEENVAQLQLENELLQKAGSTVHQQPVAPDGGNDEEDES